jgi:two-component system, NarL family, nitrate/nitrite response regulator NarL
VTIRILVVDDSEQWRLLIRSILERTGCFLVVGEASDGVEAITKATALLPNVVLLDIGMPRLNGIKAAQKIRQTCPESRIIFLTQEHDIDVRKVALAAGGVA